MSLVINTNISSINAQRNLSNSQMAMQTALQRLSSGLRINSAADDAAGLAISERMTTQVNGLNQAQRNANDGISLSQTAGAALTEVINNLQNIRELAVQSANATNSSSDRAALDAQVQQDLAQIDQIATQTAFNGQNVLDGSFGTATFQVGANVGQTITLNLANSVRTSAIGRTADYVGGATYSSNNAIGQQGAGVDVNPLASGDVTIAVGSGQAVSVGAAVAGSAAGQTADSAYAKAQAINSSGITGLTATADTTAQFALGATAIAATEAGYSLTINGQAIYTNYSGVTNGAVTADQLVQAINANSATTGVTASYDSVNTRITLSASDGRDISVTQNSTTNADNGTAQGLGAASGVNNTSNAAKTLANVAGTAHTAGLVGSVRLSAADSITIGGTAARIGFLANSYALGASALNSADVLTVASANTTISRVDAALQSVSALESQFGAIQNRFQSTISNLAAVSQNLSAARSRIQDADFGAETANLTRAQILQQAGVAMLAQANTQPQAVLKLLA